MVRALLFCLLRHWSQSQSELRRNLLYLKDIGPWLFIMADARARKFDLARVYRQSGGIADGIMHICNIWEELRLTGNGPLELEVLYFVQSWRRWLHIVDKILI